MNKADMSWILLRRKKRNYRKLLRGCIIVKQEQNANHNKISAFFKYARYR